MVGLLCCFLEEYATLLTTLPFFLSLTTKLSHATVSLKKSYCLLLFKGPLGLLSGFYQEGYESRFLVKQEINLQTQRCFLFYIVLLLESNIFNFLKFLKHVYKNLLHSRGPCLLSSVTEIMLFHCFSSSIVVYFAFSSVNLSFFHLCHIVYNVSSAFLLFASILAGPRNPVVFRLIQETALKAQMPY